MDWIRAPRTYSEPSAHRKSSSEQVCVRAAKPWRNATEWSGALSLSSKPPAAPARILIIGFSDSIASGGPGMRRIGIGFGSLVSNTDVSLAGTEQSKHRTDRTGPETVGSGRPIYLTKAGWASPVGGSPSASARQWEGLSWRSAALVAVICLGPPGGLTPQSKTRHPPALLRPSARLC